MPLPVGSAPIPAGWDGVEEHAGAIYIFRSGWIKLTEEMCRESLSLLHTLFRKLGLQSITAICIFFFFFPLTDGGFVPGRKCIGSGKSMGSVPKHQHTILGQHSTYFLGVPGPFAAPMEPPW